MERRFGGLAWRLYDVSFTGISAFAALSNPHRPAVPPFAAQTPAAQSCRVFPQGLGGTQVVSVSASRDPALAANQLVLTSIPVPDARGPTRLATVAVNPPLPKVIVSPSSHTLPTPSKGTCSRHTCCIMMNMNQPSLSQGSPWGFPFTTMAHITHAPPEIICLLSRLLL